MPTDVYLKFIAKYPIFGNEVFGGRDGCDLAYSLALIHVAYYESLGVLWGDFKQIAIEFKTACELQNRYNQKSGALASISSSPPDNNSNQSLTQSKIKSVDVDGEYKIEYETSDSSKPNSKQLEINEKNAGYYCDEFENLKNLLLENQIGNRFLYSHEN